MQAYKAIISTKTTLVLSTNSDLFKFLKRMAPDAEMGPRAAVAPMTDSRSPRAAED